MKLWCLYTMCRWFCSSPCMCRARCDKTPTIDESTSCPQDMKMSKFSIGLRSQRPTLNICIAIRLIFDLRVKRGAMPRKDGMERADLLTANGGIFKPQGRAIAKNAKKNVKVLVVGNPANTNAFIAMSNAPEIDPKQFTAMTRLDHNRAVAQLAQRVGKPVTSIKKMTIWGNHSASQYPDLYNCEVDGKNAATVVNDETWARETFIPTVAKRGAAIIKARGLSSAASAGTAAMDHMRNWVQGTPAGDWVSMSVPSDGSYGVPA
ncbi:MAG: malate dehydrogenase, partial [Actinobacteria bacterium]|nr:malate dehydrogenase [Actinomycetota bacterium]